MKPLIEIWSLLYRKRLVRELNNQVDGFYANIATMKVRCNRARIVKGEPEVHSLSCSPAWFKPSNLLFEDAYGREIVASRKNQAAAA
jgi:hypothetical protein